ncbi:MAG: PD40 domain-containing protein [Acidobacteria bacterium]|nr:PD40 domain-containing protein [Acidobacteriota bacterium]MBS1865079.1 PD40 domain-containing protein [Acidobacteriota bacterium]
MHGTSQDRVKFGPFEADVHTHEIWKYGVKIKLVGQPFEVLAILLEKPGGLVTREELRSRLWAGDTFVDFDHGLNAAVNRLREALSDSAEAPRYIETLPRRGYRFIAPVEKAGSDAPILSSASPQPAIARAAAPESNAEIAPLAQAESLLTLPPRSHRWLRRLAYLGGAGVVLVALFVAVVAIHKKIAASSGMPVAFSPMQRIRPLTNLADETSEPAFSPDGNLVAFRRHSDKPGVSGIYVKRIDADETTQITSSSGACCPAWAPDGRTIAFTRFSDGNDVGIFLAPATKTTEKQLDVNGQKLNVVLNAAEKRLDTHGVAPKRGELAWAPDGKSIVFASATGLALYSFESDHVKRLTDVPPLSEDWGPSFSPDGETILFVRSGDAGIPEEIMSVPKSGGQTTRIASEHSRILGAPQWAVDGKSIVFASDFGSHPGLWRLNLDAKDAPAQINDSGWRPAIARTGYRLAYQRTTHSLNIWQLELPDAKPGISPREQHILVPFTSETDQGPGPQISPDGQKLAFMSSRSGTMEIWVSDRDGSNPVQLTTVGNAGTPRWSPDSQSIVFDTSDRTGSKIYKIRLDRPEPQLLTMDEFENRCPSWSRDGKWIYFASTRTEKYQVWKIPSEGGAPVQVTRDGGHAAFESADGKILYYAKTGYANPEIWQVPVNGGAEKLVAPQLKPFTWASWSVVNDGIIFAQPSGTGRPWISFFDPTHRTITKLGEIQTVPFWLGASWDGKAVVFDQPGWQQSQIMLVENFR